MTTQENLTEEQTQKIVDFLNSLKTEVSITDYVELSDIDFTDAYNSIYDKIQDNNGFDIEIIYYSNAIAYLQENDPSLRESLEIAMDYGFDIKNLSSETLASLLASQNAQEEFSELQSEIDTFFEEMSEEIEND